MDKLKGNLLYGQSGGPTSVINSSAYGVIKEALKNKDAIGEIYCMKHGIQGVLKDDLIKVSDLSFEDVELLVNTPGAAFGTIRYKMKEWEEDEKEYKRILEILKKYNIRYFLYNGGNDSMETCREVDEYLKKVGYDCRVIGIPKTIDNDLPVTDHCPGYGSAAKYIANACMEIACDSSAYPKGKVTIAEIMGRHTGWLTAASYVASASSFGPDLIYVPEVPFSIEKFKEDIKKVMTRKDHCLVAVSEGIQDGQGNFIAAASGTKDPFGHTQLGGVCHKLAAIVSDELGYSTRPCELSLLQRSAVHLQSKTDVDEAINVGRYAVRYALAGKTSVMVAMRRANIDAYRIVYFTVPLKDVAAVEKTLPRTMINPDGNYIQPEFLAYVLPLIDGHHKPQFRNGVMRFTTVMKP